MALNQCARQFVEHVTWPNQSTLLRESARVDIDLPEFIYGALELARLTDARHAGTALRSFMTSMVAGPT